MIRKGIKRVNYSTYGTLIDVYSKGGLKVHAFCWLGKMSKIGMQPDEVTTGIVLQMYKKAREFQKAEHFFKKWSCEKSFGMLSIKDNKVDSHVCLSSYTYNTMIDTYGKSGQIKEASETFKRMLEMYIESEMLQKSWSWFKRFHVAGNMSSEGYSANIDAYGGRVYISETEKVFICCEEVNKRTVIEYNVMIKAYGIGKSCEKACELFESMMSYGVTPDKCTYNTLVQILANADMPHKARCYLEKMREMGYVSNCIPYYAVTSSFLKLGQLNMAEEVYKEMVEFSIEPDVIVYGVLINALICRYWKRPPIY